MSDTSVRTTPVTNYKTYSSVSGKYRYTKIPLNNQAGNSITLDANTSQLLEWKLPVGVYNLSKSVIGYNIELAANAAANHAFVDSGLEIAQSITFGTAGGMNLVDLNFANNYLSVARKIDTRKDDFENNDVSAGLYPANDVASNFFPPGYTPEAGNVYGLAAAARDTAASLHEPQYLSSGAKATKLEVSRSFPLGNISGTLFAMNRDLFLADTMYLRMQTAPSSKVAYLATEANDPITGAAVLAAQPVLRGVYLYLAMEQDQLIKDSLMQKFAEGKLVFPIDFTYGFRNPSVGAGQQAVQIQLTAQYGRKLKRVLHTVFPANETLNNAYDHSNWSGSKVTSYQSAIDSQPLQDSYLNCVQPSIANPGNALDDFRENMKSIRKSVIANSASYQLNWFHSDEFSEPSMDPNIPDSNIVEGLDLTLPRTYQISLNTTGANYSHYTFCKFIREIAISATGPVFMA